MIHLHTCRQLPTHNPTLHFIYWYATIEIYSKIYIIMA